MNTIDIIVRELTAALGPEAVATEGDILDRYSRDETSDLCARPDIVVRARSVQDVSAVMAVCSRHRFPVVPRGAGTGVTGGAVPVRGGLVLSLEKLNRILEIDTDNMAAVVQPGVITADLQKAALAEGLLYPPDPASLDMCSLGGNVAENAGGPRAVRYGTTKDYVLGLQYVLPDGSVIRSGGKFVKNATGYNIIGLLTGSEGTLAIITEIVLRLVPAPRHSCHLLVPYGSVKSAVLAVRDILLARIVPTALEFMEKDAIDLVARHIGSEMPFPDAAAHLLVQLDAASEEALQGELVALNGALGVDPGCILVAESALHRERLWKARRSIREAVHAESPVFLAEDCVVPRSRIPDFLMELKEYFGPLGLRSVMFGHAGDGNVHVDVLKDAIDDRTWREGLPDLKMNIYRRAVALGGTITGEHGIGCTRREYLSVALDHEEIELTRRLKRAFDPLGILNPGKVV